MRWPFGRKSASEDLAEGIPQQYADRHRRWLAEDRWYQQLNDLRSQMSRAVYDDYETCGYGMPVEWGGLDRSLVISWVIYGREYGDYLPRAVATLLTDLRLQALTLADLNLIHSCGLAIKQIQSLVTEMNVCARKWRLEYPDFYYRDGEGHWDATYPIQPGFWESGPFQQQWWLFEEAVGRELLFIDRRCLEARPRFDAVLARQRQAQLQVETATKDLVSHKQQQALAEIGLVPTKVGG